MTVQCGYWVHSGKCPFPNKQCKYWHTLEIWNLPKKYLARVPMPKKLKSGTATPVKGAGKELEPKGKGNKGKGKCDEKENGRKGKGKENERQPRPKLSDAEKEKRAINNPPAPEGDWPEMLEFEGLLTKIQLCQLCAHGKKLQRRRKGVQQSRGGI